MGGKKGQWGAHKGVRNFHLGGAEFCECLPLHFSHAGHIIFPGMVPVCTKASGTFIWVVRSFANVSPIHFSHTGHIIFPGMAPVCMRARFCLPIQNCAAYSAEGGTGQLKRTLLPGLLSQSSDSNKWRFFVVLLIVATVGTAKRSRS